LIDRSRMTHNKRGIALIDLSTQSKNHREDNARNIEDWLNESNWDSVERVRQIMHLDDLVDLKRL